MAVSSLVVVAAVAAAPTASAPSSTAVIRLGLGIGKVRLGMGSAEVRRALGRPQLVNRVQDRGFGNRYVEYRRTAAAPNASHAGTTARTRARGSSFVDPAPG